MMMTIKIIILLIIIIIIFIIIYARIDYAQPAQAPPYQTFLNPTLSSLIRHSCSNDVNNSDENDTSGTSNSNSDDSFFCVGDHRETATLNGALVSGRRAAELIIKSRK
jgi:cell division protein FtsI/penicillin-binding protein 2